MLGCVNGSEDDGGGGYPTLCCRFDNYHGGIITMALVVADRIKETTSTTGTGTYTLGGASTGFEAFSVIGNSNTTYYCCTDGTDFEIGIGTYTASGTTLARTTILQSSNLDAAVNWGSGIKTIFLSLIKI